MKRYYRVMLGKNSMYADQCAQENFIGADYGIQDNLAGKLPEDWREFNRKFIPIFLEAHPGKTRVGAGLSCGALWTLCKGMLNGDIVLCPDGAKRYRVGQIAGDYKYAADEILPHRRPVTWLSKIIDRSDMSDDLRHSGGGPGAVRELTPYADEIERLLVGSRGSTIISTDSSVENPGEFAMEKHLEDFLVANWDNTELSKKYDIYVEDGEIVGQQYQTDTGPIDILAISKNKKELLVIELKKGRSSDPVVGQIQRYMGYVKEELAEDGQEVRGLIIALSDDLKFKRALSVAPSIEFCTYKVHFSLSKK
jgi:restriction system protein